MKQLVDIEVGEKCGDLDNWGYVIHHLDRDTYAFRGATAPRFGHGSAEAAYEAAYEELDNVYGANGWEA